jgi:hypothetical protein
LPSNFISSYLIWNAQTEREQNKHNFHQCL